MASSRKDLLNRYAELGFRHGDVRGAQTAIRLEIEERKEQYIELKKEIEDRPAGDNSSTVKCNTPYSLVVGEVDSNNLSKSKGKGVEATQILETVSLKDSKGNDLGRVRFESGSGIGVSLSNRYEDTIYIHGGQLQGDIKKNAEQISKNVDNCYRNTSAIAANATDISDLLTQIKELQEEVALLKASSSVSKTTKKK